MRALSQALNKVLNNVIRVIGGNQFATDKILAADAKEIKSALIKATAAYMKETQLAGDTAVTPMGVKLAATRAEFKNQTLPTRWPTAKGLSPSVDDPLVTDMATLRQDQTQYAKAVNALLKDPGMHSPDIVEGTLDEKAEHIIERMKDNLLWLFDQIPEAIRNRSKLWYDGARKIVEAWAIKYEISESQAAGALAVLSPQKDWFMNVTMAERVLDIVHTKMDFTFDARMAAAAFSFLTKDSIKDDPDAQKNLNAFNAVKGKTLRQVAEHNDLRQLSVWIRAYDEAYHDAKHAIVTPEGGFVEDKTTVKGDPTMRAWGDFTTPGKAASIYLDGTPENINKQLGREHKVRNFYNNIFAPKDPRFLTVDTHAVAANELRPLAGADTPVAENFGKTGGTNTTGLSGTYAIHHEAYNRAAEARGVLPREMQSITWEAIRGLFTEGYKGKKENIAAVDAIWAKVDAGVLSIDAARRQILEHAGGIHNPDWYQEGNAEYSAVLRDTTYVQEREHFQGARVTFEVAPDPRNTELKNRWDALPNEVKADISYKVAWKIAARALASFGDENMKGELHQQLGGWLDDTNPSLSIWFNKRAAASKISEFARMLGFALNQMGMMRTSPRPFKSSDGKAVKPSGAVVIQRIAGDDVNLLYRQIRGILGGKGKPIVFGHTTNAEQMIIIHPDESEITTRELAKKIDEVIDKNHKVGAVTLYVEFPEKGRNSYGLRGKHANPSESSLRARSDQFRAEAGVLLDQLIGEHEARGPRLSTRRSDGAGNESDRTGAAGRTALVSTGAGSQGRPSYGTGVNRHAVSAVGVHYSREQRDALSSRFFGTGMKAEERIRLGIAKDPRIKRRLYFYTNTGKGIYPESDVGAHAHSVALNNLYDMDVDALRLYRHGGADGSYRSEHVKMNEFESAIIDAGYDGYLTHQFGRGGAAVLLGDHSVPVRYEGVTKSVAVPQTAPPAYPDAVALQEKINNDRRLPAGRMSGADWKRMVPTFYPDLDLRYLEDGKEYYKDQLVPKPPLDLLRFSTPRQQPWYYSALEQGLRDKVPKHLQTQLAGQWRMWLAGNLNKLGAKAEEYEWSGLGDYLGTLGKTKLTAGDLADWVANNGVKVEDVIRGRFFDPDNPRLPEGWQVVSSDYFPQYEMRSFSHVAIDVDELPIGWGHTEDEAINDAYSSNPEYFESIEDTKYADYVPPGSAGGYKEVLLTLPSATAYAKGALTKFQRALIDKYDTLNWKPLATEQERNEHAALELRFASRKEQFRSSHWDEPNVLAHIRYDTVAGAKGDRLMRVIEIQSDWGQKGKREGFGTPETARISGEVFQQESGDWGVRWADGNFSGGYDRESAERIAAAGKTNTKFGTPAAPFVTDTKSWTALAIKRVISLAVEGDYDGIVFAKGQQNADLYDLSKQIKQVTVKPALRDDGSWELKAYDINDARRITETISDLDKLEEFIGKEASLRAVKQIEETGSADLRGLDLKVGGEGMRAFYDQIVPQVANDVLRRIGAGVKVGPVATSSGQVTSFNAYDANGELVSAHSSRWKAEKAAEEMGGHVEADADSDVAPGFAITDALRTAQMPLFSTQRSREELHAGADAIRAMSEGQRDNTAPWDMPGGYRAFLLYEAQKLLPKAMDKLRKATERNSFALHQDYDSIANVDGVHYGINKYEDPDDDEDENKFVFAFDRLDDAGLRTVETVTDQQDELFAAMRKNNVAPAPKLSAQRFSPHRSVAETTADFTDAVRAYFKAPQPQPVALAEVTPASLQVWGWRDLPLVVEPDVIEKMFYDHGVTIPQLGKLPALLHRPMMIFADEKNGSLVFAGDDFKAGKVAIVAMKPDRSGANMVVTGYAPNNGWDEVTKRIARGELVYRDTSKAAPEAVRQALAAAQKRYAQVGRSLPRELLQGSDLLNDSLDRTQSGTRGPTVNPARAVLERAYMVLGQSELVKFETESFGAVAFSRTRPGQYYDPATGKLETLNTVEENSDGTFGFTDGETKERFDFPTRAQADVAMGLKAQERPEVSLSRQRVADALAGVDLQNDIANAVKFKLADIIAPAKGFNLWHKTVGTQFHKAMVEPLFKKVFDLGQKFLDDVQLFALRAESMAPSIFPKLDKITLANLKNMGLSSKDNALLGRAIAEGTLENGPNPHDGAVFTDAQLQARFNMSQEQIGHYRQARAAIDKSLDGLAASEMAQHIRISGADNATVERIVRSDQPLAAKHGQLSQLVDALELANPGKDYSDTRKHLKGILSTTDNLKAHGYAPLMRFGSRTVTGFDATGAVTFFTMVDTDAEASTMKQELLAAGGYARVVSGKMDTESFKLFGGVTPDTLELFANHAAMPMDDLMQEYLKLAISNRSAMKRMIQRQGTLGFSTDATRVLATFLTSNGRRASTNLHMANMAKAVTTIPNELGDVKSEAAKLVEYIQTPAEEAAKLRGFLFFNFLGGSLAAGIVNLTQPVLQALPYLSKYGAAKAGTAMKLGLEATAQFMRGKRVADPALQAALLRAQSDGHINPQEIYQMMAASQSGASSFLSHKVQRVWGLNFSLTEMFNCVFHANWTVIPRQAGHAFHMKLDSRSAATRG